ncbi:MAG TPA: hypothetical protein VG367_09765 [Mucilaginibacter sp.]|jgi:archaellum component FlaF (FlaF/FlaG flagellin family)|nr:hypothetical protein [Mucilaginibacter sp.]
MRKPALLILFLLSGTLCFAQKNLLSYEDLKYLLTNSLPRADTFMMAKGYQLKVKNTKNNNRVYSSVSGDSHVDINVRQDGKRLLVEIETNVLSQYDLIHNSIAQYVTKDAMTPDVQTYVVKNLGTIYITVTDTSPYDPLKREYDIHVVPDKRITAYN